MNIARYSLDNTKVIYFFLAILLVGGVLSFDLLGKKEDSPFVIKTAVIITKYPGATPAEVEQLITEPIEREIQSMRRVKKIKSDSYYGMSKIQIELNPATPPDEMPQMWDELRRKVLNIQPALPQGASTISVSDDFGDVFGIYYGLTAAEGFSYHDLRAWDDDCCLTVLLEAACDAPTIVNLTNHSYFNLSGDPTHPILDNLLTIAADGYTPVDSTFLTLGRIDSVGGTPFDFRRPKAIGAEIDSDDEQLRNGHGYDHNWVLATAGDLSRPAARLVSPVSGIALEVFTDEPGIQVYVGNFLDGTVRGKHGIPYAHRTAVCLETQHYPDSPNKPQWPSVVLRPGETYHSRCIYRFSVDK